MPASVEEKRIARLTLIVRLTESNTVLKCPDCLEPLFAYDITYGMPHCSLICKKCRKMSPFMEFQKPFYYKFEEYREEVCPHCGKKFLFEGKII